MALDLQSDLVPKGTALAAGGLLLLLLLGLLSIRSVLRSPLAKVPGPWYTLWTRLPLTYCWLTARRAAYVHRLHEQYGPIVRLAPDEVDVADLPAVRALLHSVKTGFNKTPWYRDLTSARTETVFSTADISFHRRHRRLLAAPMAESALRVHAEPVVRRRCEQAIRGIRRAMQASVVVADGRPPSPGFGAADVFQWNMFLATDVIGELSFGQSFRMLDSGRKNQYVADLQLVSRLSGIRTTFPRLLRWAHALPSSWLSSSSSSLSLFLPILMPISLVRVAAAADDRLRHYARTSLARYKRLVAGSAHPPPTLLTRLFQDALQTSGDPDYRDDNVLSEPEILSTAQAYIVAGSDTTSNTLTYLMWSVARDPPLRDALVAELRGAARQAEAEKAGADQDQDAGPRPAAHDDDDYPATFPFADRHLRDLPLLNQIIHETLRLYPAVPGGMPRAVPPGGVHLEVEAANRGGRHAPPSSYDLPAGLTVTVQAYTMHRNPAIFPRPTVFDPARWAHPTKAMRDSLTAFGGGARVCLGMHLAYMEIRLMTALFFSHFPDVRVSTQQGMTDADMEPSIFFLMAPAGRRCLLEASV